MQKRQALNFGPYAEDPEAVEMICAEFEKIIFELRQKGLPRPTRKDLAVSYLSVFAKRVRLFLDNPAMTFADTKLIAVKESIRERLFSDYKGQIGHFLEAIWIVAERHAGEVAEVMLSAS